MVEATITEAQINLGATGAFAGILLLTDSKDKGCKTCECDELRE